MTTSKERENSLWKWLKKAADKHAPSYWHLHRVENSVETGCPDVEGFSWAAARGFWTELKCCAEPGPKGLVDIALTGEQQYWLFARDRVGGLAWLLVRVGSGHKRRHYLLHGGEYLKEVVKNSVTEDWLLEKSAFKTAGPSAYELLQQMAVRGPVHWDDRKD